MWRHGLEGSFVMLGRRVPLVIGGLIGITLLASIVGALGFRAGLPLLPLAALVPEQVWRGELWRLVTWAFFELDPISLIFACLVLWWFGQDLCTGWGSRRFLLLFLGCTVSTGVLTTLAGGLTGWQALLGSPFLGAWPIADAIILAWALAFPSRRMLLYFVLPVGGETLVYLVVGGTVLFAIFQGLGPYVPHLMAEGLALLYLKGMTLRRLWLRLRLANLERQFRRDSRRLRIVRSDDDGKDRWLH